MPEPNQVRTQRLDLRQLGDAARALRDDREAAARALHAVLPPDWPSPDLLDLLRAQSAAAAGDARFGVWVIVERQTNTIVGDIGFVGPPDAGGSVELGYSIVPGRRRRGYATEAARALIEWALRQADVVTVVAGCESGNVGSIRTLERLGFARTGKNDDEIRWRHHGEPSG